MPIDKEYNSDNRAALFDWLVFLTSVSLGFVFPTFMSLLTSPAFSLILFFTLLAYVIGTWLKHLPLYYRMLKNGRSAREIPYYIFLVIGHWLVILIALLFSESAFRKLFHLKQASRTTEGWTTFIFIILSTFITWLVFHHRKRIKEAEYYKNDYLYWRETIGDALLLLSVSVLTFVFWERGVMAGLSRGSISGFQDIAFKFLFLGLGYMFVYLPLRYLFLVEDHSSKATWRRLMFIFALVLLRSLFEMLGI